MLDIFITENMNTRNKSCSASNKCDGEKEKEKTSFLL
jgi:hypothetical protein